jgi:amidase
VDQYSAALRAGVAGLRIGVLREGFGPRTEADVEEKVRSAARRFERLGAVVSEVSVPTHTLAGLLAFGTIQSSLSTMLETDGCALGRPDPIAMDYLRFHRRWRQRADELPETVKTCLILAEYVRREVGYEYYAKSVNETRRLRGAYDAALQQVDLLLMPTTPMKATPLPAPDAAREVVLDAAFSPVMNTSPFNATHHPAMSIPCGMSQGLPVGLMLVGRHYEESTIYRAAHAFEQHEDWRSL